jgi:NAD(P)-dependent dehydrogenase (short-subunit alcohol dehydrogenase family)
MSSSKDIHLLCSRVRHQFGRADILVHCAGAIAHTNLEDAPPEVLDQLLLTNVRGPMLLTQGLLPLLKKTARSNRFHQFQRRTEHRTGARLLYRHTACAQGSRRYAETRSQR